MASKKKVSKKGTRAATANRRAEKPARSSGGLIPLKRICADLGLDPKAARVRLRRAWRKTDEKGKPEGNVEFHEKNARWDLTPAQAKEVRAILGG